MTLSPHAQVRRQHQMRFGPEFLPDNQIRFRLWAPSVDHVALKLEDCPEEFPMERHPDGWFTLETDQVGPGSLYRFRINGDLLIPDPASRYQPQDVHGPSQVMDPAAFQWLDKHWKGRPWEETILYELHVGSFTPEGTFLSAIEKLDELVELGITAIELMPLADFPGKRNWGYDGVLPFAPDNVYGAPDDLKALVQAAHQKGLMVFLDVVYNHFGPEGNYLWCTAQPFFTDKHQTPWGVAIDFEGLQSAVVRDFFIQNALYWLNEFHFDGLRFDAVHAIRDESQSHILEAIAQAVYAGPGASRHIHLVLENDANEARFLSRNSEHQPIAYVAQWNDDCHHALHVLTSQETSGYYEDYADYPAGKLARCLTEGFAFQGGASAYRHGERRGKPSAHLPSTAFVSFLQNHDQVGNRAFGDRIFAFSSPERIRAAAAVYLLSPQIPMVFMGEEWGCSQPFPFFCDFGPDLAQKVTEGRRKEFARFPEFSRPESQAKIPDPNALDTFESCVLNWEQRSAPAHQPWLAFYQKLIALRHQYIVPLLKQSTGYADSRAFLCSPEALAVCWTFSHGAKLTLMANFGSVKAGLPNEAIPVLEATPVYESSEELSQRIFQGILPPASVILLMH